MKTYTYNKSTVWFLSTPILLSYSIRAATTRGFTRVVFFCFQENISREGCKVPASLHSALKPELKTKNPLAPMQGDYLSYWIITVPN